MELSIGRDVLMLMCSFRWNIVKPIPSPYKLQLQAGTPGRESSPLMHLGLEILKGRGPDRFFFLIRRTMIRDNEDLV